MAFLNGGKEKKTVSFDQFWIDRITNYESNYIDHHFNNSHTHAGRSFF